MGLIILSAVCAMIFANVQVKGGDVIPVKKCATLFSDANFEGRTFSLIDFDQSANLVREYRQSLNGWNRTRSISVEDACTLVFCSDPYFDGKCENLTVSKPSITGSTIVNSVECTCQRKCSCSDIFVPRDYDEYGTVARAYLEGGCDTCNSEYLPVLEYEKGYEKKDFPKQYTRRVTALVIADGCVMKISKDGGGFVTMQGPVIKVNLTKQRFPSFRAECPKRPSLPMPVNEPQLLRLPATLHKLYEFVRSQNYSAAHPGLQAALKSAENRRSAANVYIVFFGDADPYSTGFSKCENAPYGFHNIWECNMLVPLRDLGISTELHLIVVPAIYDSGPVYYKLKAALEKHLSAIEDLNNAIPNAVIIQDDNPNSLDIFSGKFNTMLAMIPRILDTSNPNILFLLNQFDVRPNHQRRPDKGYIPLFEKEIRKKWSFPINVCVTPTSQFRKVNTLKPLYIQRNGYERMSNMEYWPLNLEKTLNYICERGGDPLGRETLKAYFQDNITPLYSVKPIPSRFE